jgi:hypothetical protein
MFSPNKLEPIYYNLTLVNGYQNPEEAVTVPANIEEFNNSLILENQSQYYISIARATIPTSRIPRLIVPIQTGLLQTDKNKCIYTFKMKLCTSVVNNQFLFDETYTTTLAVNYISDAPFLFDQTLAPSNNRGNQDLSNIYYYVYDIETVILMFNNTLKQLFKTFATQIGLTYNPAYYPFILWNSDNRLFEIVLPASVNNNNYFAQDNGAPFIVLQLDNLGVDLFQIGNFANNNDLYRTIYCFNKFNNNIVKTNGADNILYYNMSSSQSSLNNWGALNKIVFTVGYGVSTVQEYDSVPIINQGSTINNLSQKPLIPILQDLEVNKDEFAVNSNYIIYQTSSIAQSRLISMTGGLLQSFQLSVYWVDVFSIRHPLFIPQGLPLTIKLAFYPKTTTLI